MWAKGYKRINNIFDLLETHKYLRTWMIAEELFQFKTGKQKCALVMNNIYQKQPKLIKRFTYGSKEYIYHMENKVSNKWMHWDLINTFHFNLVKQLNDKSLNNNNLNTDNMYNYRYIINYILEYNYGYGQADGFYIVKLSSKKATKFFLEIDNTPGHFFDKIQKYNYKYESRWQDDYFADPLKSKDVKPEYNTNENALAKLDDRINKTEVISNPVFPKIIILTKRVKDINNMIHKDNKHNLKFIIGKLEDGINNPIDIIQR